MNWDWLFPRRCAACRDFLQNKKSSLCQSCEKKWVHITEVHCTLCLLPLTPDQPAHLCGDCLESESHFENVQALGLYEEPLKNLIWRFKFRGEERLASFFGSIAGEKKREYDVILPIPLYSKKLRDRGYNQSVLLAKTLSKKWGVSCNPFVLQKIKDTLPQSELTGNDRRENLKGAFQVKDEKIISGKRVLLIDDVYTTGATIREASRVLKKNGAKSIDVFVIARAL